MKGLLLKDWYVARAYCRVYPLVSGLFLIVSLFSTENQLFLLYPSLFFGMIPITLLAYDERSHFLQYGGSLPYDKAEFVKAKYLIGLAGTLLMSLLTMLFHGIRMAVLGEFSVVTVLSLFAVLFCASVVAFSLTIPFMFRYGVEKGRMAYYVMIGIMCGLASFMQISGYNNVTAVSMSSALMILLPIAIGLAVFRLSLTISTRGFEKRSL